MAGGGNFMARVISYVANEFIVNGLANSFFLWLIGFFMFLIGSFILKRDSLNLHAGLLRQIPYAAAHAFQRFAVRTSKRIENISKMAAESKEKVAQHIEELSKNTDSFKKS